MCALRSACEYFDCLLHLCSGRSCTAEMEHRRQRESSKSAVKHLEASSSLSVTALRKCSSMYEQTNKSTNHPLKKCRTSTDMPVENDFNPEKQDSLAHIIARPDVSLLKRRESERTLPTSALAQLFNNNQRKAGENSRILLNITMRGSPGPLKVIVDSHSDRTQVMKQALAVYAREGRLPVLLCGKDAYELYCGHDMSTAVPAEQRIGSFGYRNFLMCPRTATATSTHKQSSKELDKTNTTSFFMSYYVHITM